MAKWKTLIIQPCFGDLPLVTEPMICEGKNFEDYTWELDFEKYLKTANYTQYRPIEYEYETNLDDGLLCLFEVNQRVKEANAGRRHDAPGRRLEGSSHFFSELQANPELAIDFIIAPPRMAYYMEYSTRIYEVYMKYIAPEDIVVYSIDEVFMDVTDYLNTYKLSPHDLAMKIILDVLETTGILQIFFRCKSP